MERLEPKTVKVEKTRTVRWSFPTIKALVTDLGKIIDSPVNCHSKQAFLLAAVNNYDKVYEQASPAVRVYSDFPTKEGKGMGKFRCLHVVLENGRILTVAKDAVARAAKDPEATAARRKVDARTTALRNAVADQIQDFRDDHRYQCETVWQRGRWLPGMPPNQRLVPKVPMTGIFCPGSGVGKRGIEKCSLGRIRQPWSDLQVDHCGDMEFRHIVDAFGDSPLHQRWGDYKHWRAHHKKYAKLQLICKTCNLKKPKHTHEELVELSEKRDEHKQALRRLDQQREQQEAMKEPPTVFFVNGNGLIEPNDFCKLPMV